MPREVVSLISAKYLGGAPRNAEGGHGRSSRCRGRLWTLLGTLGAYEPLVVEGGPYPYLAEFVGRSSYDKGGAMNELLDLWGLVSPMFPEEVLRHYSDPE